MPATLRPDEPQEWKLRVHAIDDALHELRQHAEEEHQHRSIGQPAEKHLLPANPFRKGPIRFRH